MLEYTYAGTPTHQGSTAEETTLQKLNQGVCTDVLYYHPRLTFLGTFCVKTKSTEEKYT